MFFMKKREEVHFDNIDYYLTEHLRSCKSSLKICVAWISWGKYERLFKSLAEKGVKIEIIDRKSVV